jgi:dTDP-4-amino-4,6-dideoxygalactose transaminase
MRTLIADVDPSSADNPSERVRRTSPFKASRLVVHYPLGFVPDLEALSQFGLPIIEDISTAFGSHTGVKRVVAIMGDLSSSVVNRMESSQQEGSASPCWRKT